MMSLAPRSYFSSADVGARGVELRERVSVLFSPPHADLVDRKIVEDGFTLQGVAALEERPVASGAVRAERGDELLCLGAYQVPVLCSPVDGEGLARRGIKAVTPIGVARS